MPTTLTDYAQVLQGSFAAFVAAHHTITGHVITINGDHAIAHVRAEHWVPSDATGNGSNRWLLVGFYDNEAIRTDQWWRFGKVKLTASYQENTHLLAQAAAGG